MCAWVWLAMPAVLRRWPSLLCHARCSVEMTSPIPLMAVRFHEQPSVGLAGNVVGQDVFELLTHGPLKPCRPSESNSYPGRPIRARPPYMTWTVREQPQERVSKRANPNPVRRAGHSLPEETAGGGGVNQDDY